MKKSIIAKLQKALSQDDGYYYGWQSNIAMSFVDEYSKTKGYVSKKKLHKIANKAAKNFLDLLIVENKRGNYVC